jgi:adenosylcobinamide-GDP ribazoletransferase
MEFLTLMPPVFRRMFAPREMGRSVAYFPLVGFVIGLILLAADHLLSLLLPPLLTSALLLALWVLLTAGLHVDGFLDACDGLLGGTTPERRLAIMRDERIGAFAFTGGALLFIMKFSALSSLTLWRVPALILAPVMGRWGISLALVFFPYARSDGLGKDMKDHATWREAALATLIAMGAAWLAAGWHGMIIGVLTLVLQMAIVLFTLKRIPGLTGDIYGMINEISEVVVLVAFCLFH